MTHIPDQAALSLMPTYEVVIVGAGISGLMAGQTLQAHGIDNYLIVDKATSVGGRFATRRMHHAVLDHGAQFFTARDPVFASIVNSWVNASWVKPWTRDHKNHQRFIAMQGMNALAKQVSVHQPVHTDVHVTAITREDSYWLLTGMNHRTQEAVQLKATCVLVTIPAPQAIALFEIDRIASLHRGDPKDNRYTLDEDTQRVLQNIEYEPCLALLVVMKEASDHVDRGYIDHPREPLQWIIDNQRKGISSHPAMTLHAQGLWSRRYYEQSDAWIQHEMLEAMQPEVNLSGILDVQVKRWKYAKATRLHQASFHARADEPSLVFAGDGFGGNPKVMSGKVETAVISGVNAAHFIVTNR